VVLKRNNRGKHLRLARRTGKGEPFERWRSLGKAESINKKVAEGMGSEGRSRGKRIRYETGSFWLRKIPLRQQPIKKRLKAG